jgi:hypothetical protein
VLSWAEQPAAVLRHAWRQGLRAPLSPDDVFSTPPGWFTTQVDATTGNLLIPGKKTRLFAMPFVWY